MRLELLEHGVNLSLWDGVVESRQRVIAQHMAQLTKIYLGVSNRKRRFVFPRCFVSHGRPACVGLVPEKLENVLATDLDLIIANSSLGLFQKQNQGNRSGLTLGLELVKVSVRKK